MQMQMQAQRNAQVDICSACCLSFLPGQPAAPASKKSKPGWLLVDRPRPVQCSYSYSQVEEDEARAEQGRGSAQAAQPVLQS